jgi:hypothetical protein
MKKYKMLSNHCVEKENTFIFQIVAHIHNFILIEQLNNSKKKRRINNKNIFNKTQYFTFNKAVVANVAKNVTTDDD